MSDTNHNTDRIKVIDSYPGSGKTSWAIQEINRLSDDVKIIYITPFLDEVERIIASCPDKHFVAPENNPQLKRTKMADIIELIREGKNVVSTHALFKHINNALISALKIHNYVLYLDEVFQTVEKYNVDRTKNSSDYITKQDVESLIAKDYIKIEKDGSISWIDEDHSLSKYSKLENLAKRGLLYFVSGSLLMWTFPIEVFMEGIFTKIYILTYNFDCQLQSYYYNYFNLKYAKYHVYLESDFYIIKKTENKKHESEWKKSIKSRINILENDKMNSIGNPHRNKNGIMVDTSLCAEWYKENIELLPTLRKNLINYFRNITKSKSEERLWTCFKEYKNLLKSREISDSYWLAINARATNNYSSRATLAYLVNCFPNPFYKKFFQKRGIKINEEQYATTELIQWIWRSAIRNGENINIYIPSYRMRKLLKDFLNS